jgi:hypothetical protein
MNQMNSIQIELNENEHYKSFRHSLFQIRQINITIPVEQPERSSGTSRGSDVNYIVVPKKENMSVIINQYKTSDKYGEIKVKLSTSLSKLIRNFFLILG